MEQSGRKGTRKLSRRLLFLRHLSARSLLSVAMISSRRSSRAEPSRPLCDDVKVRKRETSSSDAW